MRLAIISSNYPWPARPYSGTFVRELVWEFARQGHICSVIAPTSVWDKVRYGTLGARLETSSVERSNGRVVVHRPRYLTTSAIRVAGFNTCDISDVSFRRAVEHEFCNCLGNFDALYAHFFYPAGKAAAYCSRKANIPYFVAHGDDEIDSWYLDKGSHHFEDIAGVVAVSNQNAIFCEDQFGIAKDKVGVFPNGVDRGLFFPRNRQQARDALNLPQDVKLIAFVGHFIPRKGPDRIAGAIEGIDNTKLLLIGEGPVMINHNQVAFRGVVDHEKLPIYLSAADIFVLPTTGEGSCNAILEAMACGLPVVSSKGEFNDDILSEKVSIRIDPLNIQEIRQAIIALISDDSRRQKMSEECIKWIAQFSIDRRAKSIAIWLSERIADWHGTR